MSRIKHRIKALEGSALWGDRQRITFIATGVPRGGDDGKGINIAIRGDGVTECRQSNESQQAFIKRVEEAVFAPKGGVQ